MNANNDIGRFLSAQDSGWSGYRTALREIMDGKKRSHWIWYIFPQLRGLGFSRMSTFYGIADSNEARAYLEHPVLGPRLREITDALLRHGDKPATTILGDIDAMKVYSCMTLFDNISPDDIFARVLETFYCGERDSRTLSRLSAEDASQR